MFIFYIIGLIIIFFFFVRFSWIIHLKLFLGGTKHYHSLPSDKIMLLKFWQWDIDKLIGEE